MGIRRSTAVAVSLALALALGAAGVIQLTAPAAAGEETYPAPSSGSWAVSGRAYGHGIGMSQWGAQGAAVSGLSADDILGFYYPGTTTGNVGARTIRVQLTALAGSSSTLAAAGGAASTLRDTATGATAAVPAGTRLRATIDPSGLFAVTNATSGARVAIGSALLTAGPLELVAPSGTWMYASDGSARQYRGTVRLLRASPAIQVVDVLPLEEYLKGVVPRESPSSWRPAALQAQAVAARSYALAVSHADQPWDICDTTSCQVFGGSATMSAGGVQTQLYVASTDAAIAATAGAVRMYGGAVAFTQFSSSNGGWSTAGSKPYLVSRADPYSGTAPGDTSTRWTRTLTVAKVAEQCPAGGTLRQLIVTGRSGQGELGGRITGLRVECSNGSRTVTASSTIAMGMLSPWWSPQQSAGAPFGHVDTVYAASGGIGIAGWAIDPSTSASIDVRVTFGGLTRTVPADSSRPDIAAAFPGQGALHGFGQPFAAPVGATTACVTAVNVGSGQDTVLGCWDLVVPAGAPQGALDGVTAGAGVITVRGWAYDADTSGAIGVHVYVGSAMSPLVADRPRSDVAALAAVGPNHGFEATIKAMLGTYRVCAFAIAVPQPSDNPMLDCRTVTVAGGSPFGALDHLSATVGGIAVSGWAIDPDLAGPSYAWVDVSGSGVPMLANGSRPDVALAYPSYDDARGFSGVIAMPGGTYRVCVTLVNVGSGSDTPLACRGVTVLGGSPLGNVDYLARVPGGIAVSGWMIDPDVAGPGYVWVDVDGAGMPVLADASRPDVARAYPGYGDRHGYSTVIPSPSGRRVCVTLVNTGQGSNTPLGCRIA